MKKLILPLFLAIGLVAGLDATAEPNQAGVVVHVTRYSPYPYALYPNYYQPYSLYPNYYHGDQNWHRWHYWGWPHRHHWRYWHYW